MQRMLGFMLLMVVLVGCGDLGDSVVDSPSTVLVPIPAGQFKMGSRESEPGRKDHETQHFVKITKPFDLGAYEVTQEQYEKVMAENPIESKGANRPANISVGTAR